MRISLILNFPENYTCRIFLKNITDNVCNVSDTKNFPFGTLRILDMREALELKTDNNI